MFMTNLDDLEDFAIFDFDDDPQEVDDNDVHVEEVMNEIIDEVTLGLCFEIHRSCKLGTFFLDETDKKNGVNGIPDEISDKQYEIVEKPGVDVFGQIPMKKQLECVCPNCSRNLAASRFAPHLEKCMGMGRNSSRIASRRIAKSGKKESDNEESDNNDDDNDWSYLADRKAKKLKKEKHTNSPRRGKNHKVKNGNGSGDIPSVGSNASDGSGSAPAYEGMTLDERKALLVQTCGVISEHTKKMCTRSHRCPQHSDEQRRAVRIYLLGQQGQGDDDIQVDIDSYEDGDSQALRDTLQWEAASNPSPTDSTSTTNSTSSKKKKSKSGSSSGSSSKKKKYTKSTTSRESAGTPSSLFDFM